MVESTKQPDSAQIAGNPSRADSGVIKDSSLEGIENRLQKMEQDELIELALSFDESPMRYFTKEYLVQLNYAKAHYVG